MPTNSGSKAKRVAIHHPNLFPRPAVIQKLAAADIWVVLDDVVFDPRGWQNRCLIVSGHGDRTPRWLTLPARLPRGRATFINEAHLIDPERILPIAQSAVAKAYRRLPRWNDLQHPVLSVLERIDTSLTNICVESTLLLLACAGKFPSVYYASELGTSGREDSERLAQLTELVGGTEYLCESADAKSLLRECFEHRGIDIKLQTWREPSPPFADCFPAANLSALNLLVRDAHKYMAVTRLTEWLADASVSAAVG